MKTRLSSDFKNVGKKSEKKLEMSGFIQLNRHPGGSRTLFAFACLNASIQADPPSPTSGVEGYYIFISDEGNPYPPALLERRIPLQKFLLVKTREAIEVWRTAIEAVQTGLFQWIFLRPSRACPQGLMRKLQLLAEKGKTRVLVFPHQKLPHWMCKASLEITYEDTAYDLRTAISILPGVSSSCHR